MSDLPADADLYARTREPGVRSSSAAVTLRTTLLDRWVFLRRRRNLALPVMPLAWAVLRTPRYDRVLTLSRGWRR
jgi:hypothetical protein